MMAERGIVVSHTTIHRWVIRYVPEFEKRWNRFARPVNTSCGVDETYIRIRGTWGYLYRAVDNKPGKTVDFLLRPDRGIAAAQAFFRKALSRSLPRWPRKITLDGHLQSHMALRLRTCPSDTQETILVRPRSISKLRVAKANLASSTCVDSHLGESPMCRADPRFFTRTSISSAFNAPVPFHRDRIEDPRFCDVSNELKRHNNVCIQRVLSASFPFSAGLRIERGIFSKSFCNKIHERTRSPRQHPICSVHEVNRHGRSVVFNQ